MSGEEREEGLGNEKSIYVCWFSRTGKVKSISSKNLHK